MNNKIHLISGICVKLKAILSEVSVWPDTQKRREN